RGRRLVGQPARAVAGQPSGVLRPLRVHHPVVAVLQRLDLDAGPDRPASPEPAPHGLTEDRRTRPTAGGPPKKQDRRTGPLTGPVLRVRARLRPGVLPDRALAMPAVADATL